MPQELEQLLGLSVGEEVEIESHDGDIIIRRTAARSRSLEAAREAAAQIIANSKGRTLGGISIKELRQEGQRG